MSKEIIQAEGLSFFFDTNGTAHIKLRRRHRIWYHRD